MDSQRGGDGRLAKLMDLRTYARKVEAAKRAPHQGAKEIARRKRQMERAKCA